MIILKQALVAVFYFTCKYMSDNCLYNKKQLIIWFNLRCDICPYTGCYVVITRRKIKLNAFNVSPEF